jgi:hypothetical protein
VVLALVFAGYLPTTQAVSDSTNHLVHKDPATRTLSHTIREDHSPPTAGDASFSSTSATILGPNAGFLLGGEDQQQNLDAAFQAPLIQADGTVNAQKKDDVFGLNFKEPSSPSSSSSAYRFFVKSFNGYDSEFEYKATLLANEKSNNYDAASSSPVLPIFEETPTDLAKENVNIKDPCSSSSFSAFRFLVKSFNDYDSEIEYKTTLANEKSNKDDADTCPSDFAAKQTASSSPVLPIFDETPTDLAKDHLLHGVSANDSILKFAESPSSLAAAVLDKNSTRSDIFTFATMAALIVGLILTRLTSPPKRGRCTVMHTSKAVRKVDIAGCLMKFPVFVSIMFLTVVGNMPTALAGTITNERITQQTTNRKNDYGAKVDFVVLTPEQSTVLYADDVRKDTTYKIDAVTRTSGLYLSSNQSKEKELLPKVRYVELTQYYATTSMFMSHGMSHTASPSELF